MDTIYVSFRVPQWQLDLIDKIADAEHAKRSATIRRLVLHGLKVELPREMEEGNRSLDLRPAHRAGSHRKKRQDVSGNSILQSLASSLSVPDLARKESEDE